MRVGIYFPCYPPTLGGGYTFEQEVLQALLEVSSESCHELVLYFDADRYKTAFSLPNIENIHATWLKSNKSISLKRFWQKSLKKIRKRSINLKSLLQTGIEKDRIQMVWFPTGLYRSVEVPYIATVWDIQHRIQPWFPEVSQNDTWTKREKMYARFYQQAAIIITPNQAGLREISLCYQIPAERLQCLSQPAPRIENHPSLEEVSQILKKYGIKHEYLIYPAQFWPHKNHVNLLLALKILLEKHKADFDLVLVGSDKGNLRHVQSKVNDLGLEDRVHILGFIPREDLIALYNGAFALTFVSYFGPENLPPLEAFACGCPVVASSIAGAVEQYGDAALFVDPSKPEEIANAVIKLQSHPDIKADLIKNGYLRAKQFSALDYVREIFKILDDFEPVRINWP